MEIVNGRIVDDGEGGGAGLGDPINVTPVSGVVNAGGAQNLIINAETGTTDTLDQITGLEVGLFVVISPASGDTITVADGASMNLGGVPWIMQDTKDKMTLQVTAVGVCDELSRSSND